MEGSVENCEVLSGATIARRLKRLHRDETGDEGVNKILIIAMIVVPLLIVLFAFRDKIVNWFKDLTGKKGNEANDANAITGE